MELVRRAQGGDREAFGVLYGRYTEVVYRYIYRRVGNCATAEDLTSETFLRVLGRIGFFTWQGRKFDAWLLTIARNLVIDHFKSSRVRLEVSMAQVSDGGEVEPSPEERVLASLSGADLRERVQLLGAQQRECVTLRFLHELTIAETACVMGKSPGAVKTLLYRAMRTLAQLEGGR